MIRRSSAFAACLLFLSAVSTVALAQTARQLTDFEGDYVFSPAIDDSGSTIFAAASADLFGSNPEHRFQGVGWALPGPVASPVAGLDRGLSRLSITDDGATLAAVSRSDPLGGNGDRSREVFLLLADGTPLAQLTNTANPGAGEADDVVVSGDGGRVLFRSTADPLGSNPSHDAALFVIDADGSGLAQLTGFPVDGFSFSDDGQRVVFASDADPLGTNGDGTDEIFAVDGDGTNLRQLTTVTSGATGAPVLSGDGNLVAFHSNAPLVAPNPNNIDRVFSIGYDGTGLTQVVDGREPSITDDGRTVFYAAALSGDNTEIYSVKASGGTATAITVTSSVSNTAPVVSGDGSRVVFLRRTPTMSSRFDLYAASGTGGSEMSLLTATQIAFSNNARVSADGNTVVFLSWSDLVGSDPQGDMEIYRVGADGTDLEQVTAFSGADAEAPAVSGDGSTIVFHSWDSLDGGDVCFAAIYRIAAAGTGLARVTPPEPGCNAGFTPDITPDGSLIVYNGLNSVRRVGADGSNDTLLVDDGNSVIKNPQVSDDGQWVVFQSGTNNDGLNPAGNIQLFRIRTDGSGYQRLTLGDYQSLYPDLSADGGKIVFSSALDLLGTNPEHNFELFLYDADSSSLTQLTTTSSGDQRNPSITADGSVVFFKSSSPFFESFTDGRYEPYRLEVATGSIRRAGAVNLDGDLAIGNLDQSNRPVTDAAGERVVFSSLGDWTLQNPDGDSEVWVVDYAEPAGIEVGKGAPTVVSWKAEASARRYDLVRGDVQLLGGDAAIGVDLGNVLCVANDVGGMTAEDDLQPLPGEVFFYVYRVSQGTLDTEDAYGEGSGGGRRLAATGDCAL